VVDLSRQKQKKEELMFSNRHLASKVRRVPSSLGLVVVLIAAISLAAVGCSGNKSPADQAAATDVLPLAARVDRLDGEVGIDRPNDAQVNGQDQTNTDWGKAAVNTPVSVGSRVYVKDKSHAAIAFSGRNYARLNPNTSLEVLSLSQRRTQLALRDGSGIFDVGALAPGELFEVATTNGAVDFQEPGLYQVGIDDGGNTLVSVLSGIAQVVGLAGSGQVGRGQLLTYNGDENNGAYVSQLDSGVCGNITNDYYSYRYPKTYDGRYADYQRYQDDPYYYDPYRRSVSYQYIPDDAEVAGLDDLDDNGDWEDVSGQGRCWHPRVSSDWAPYRDGSWYDDQSQGLTWVSNERWGWAPYHYGRWTNVNQRWYWVPGETVSRPVYAPALVAFVPFPQDDRVGWVPLGPGDPYVPRYYDRNYQPQYVGSRDYITRNVNVTNIVNYNVAGAVTVVRTTEFTRVITPRSVFVADSAMLARSRPVLDPYAVPSLRELAPETRTHGLKVRVPDTATQALSRPIVTSQDPIIPPVTVSSVKALKVKSVPDAEGKRKLKISNSGQTVVAVQPNGLPAPAVAQGGQNQNMTTQERQARVAALTAQAAQGNKAAKREIRQLEDQQRVQDKAERRAAAQTAATAQQNQQPAVAQQQKQQQKAERKAAQQQNQQPAVAQQQQQQQQKQQQKAERKAAQQQNQQPAVAQQQQKQQQKAERKAAQQQNQQPAVAQQQQKQQQKAERKAAQQQKPPPPPPQQQQQQKAERKAAQQQNPAVAQQQQQQQQQKQQQKAERKAAQQQQSPPPPPQQQQQQKAERKAAQQQQPPPPPPQQQQQKQQQKAERKAAQQQQPPAEASPSKADKRAEKDKNKTANKNGNPNQ
jgi:hypothetical protein